MKTIITIGRQYGSAGHSIGKILADDLGIKYYDKELLERAAKDSGLCQELFENHDEKPTNSFLYSLVMDSYSFGYGSTMMDMPLNQKVFLAQFDAIKKISQDGPCVIVGRCADYALEENPNVLSIFIKADMQDRIRRIAKLYDLSDAKAKDKITKIDKQRASYYNYYTSKRWGDADSYDLCIDSGKMGVDGSVELMLNAIQLKEKGYNPVNQIVGYIMSGDPTYITSYNGARSLVMKVERDEIVEELLKAYYACLELAKENAFKCTIDIETFKSSDGDFYFVVWVKAFSGIFDPDCFVPFYMFSIEKFESNIEKVKQLIQEASC